MPPLKKVKKAKPKKKPKVTIVRSERQKQAVNVNVRIDQSKKGRTSSGGGSSMVARQPANIINFPSNNPVSEIRNNPEIRYLPAPNGMTDSATTTENNLVKTTEPTKTYKNPNRPANLVNSIASSVSNLTDSFPDASQPSERISVPSPPFSVIGTVGSLGSQLLSESYPEYSGVFELASRFSQSNLARQGVNKIGQLVGDAWDNLSVPSLRTISKTSSSGSSNRLGSYITVPNLSVSPPNSTNSSGSYNTVPNFPDIDLSVSTRSMPPSDLSVSTRASTVPPSVSTRSAVPSMSDFSSSDSEEPEFVYKTVAGRVVPIEKEISKQKNKNDYQNFLADIKGQGYNRAQISTMWANKKELVSTNVVNARKKSKPKDM